MLTAQFIKDEDYTFRDYTDTGDIFSDFRKTITQPIEEEERQFRETHKSTIEYAERLAKSLKGIHIPDMTLRTLQSLDGKALTEASKNLDAALDIIGKIHFPPVQDIINGNTIAVGLFSTYWTNYYVTDEKIITNLLNTLAAQNLSPQSDLTAEIQEASQLSVKNERIFTERIREMNTYPEEQRRILYKKAEIRFFSVEEFEAILQEIKETIEKDSQHIFWIARTKGTLRKNPERIAQGHMAGLLKIRLPKKLVLSSQQVESGSGRIDFVVTFSNEYAELQKIILELKVFEEGHKVNDGIEQTAQYMEHEKTEHAYRIIFNATKGEIAAQNRLAQNGKVIKDMIININLPNPSSLDK